MLPKRKVESREIKLDGVRCVLTHPAGNPSPRSTVAVLHAVKGLNSPRQMLEIDKRARKLAASVHVEWAEEPAEDRSNVGKDHREGIVNGFRWFADWSTGCKVFVVTGPEVRHREDVKRAVQEIESHFNNRLKTIPDSIEVISYRDSRARRESSEF